MIIIVKDSKYYNHDEAQKTPGLLLLSNEMIFDKGFLLVGPDSILLWVHLISIVSKNGVPSFAFNLKYAMGFLRISETRLLKILMYFQHKEMIDVYCGPVGGRGVKKELKRFNALICE